MNLIKKIFQKFKNNNYENIPSPSENFKSVIEIAEVNIHDKDDLEKIVILDYIIDILKIDICSSGIVEPFIIKPSSPYKFPFPFRIYDENENQIEIFCGQKEITLENTDIYVRPWDTSRQFKNILNLKDKDFVYDKDNHYSYYYNDINLCYVFNGNHSINAGKYFKKGKIISTVCDITLLYHHCYTDGIHWYNSHTNNIITDVDDFRLAVIYQLAKKRYFIRNNINNK